MSGCVIYANCQGDGLKLFLHKMGFPHEIVVFRNYQMILGEQKFSDLEEACEECSVFIYQPTGDNHREFSSGSLIKKMTIGTQLISFAYLYNHGLHPITEHGGKFPGSEFIPDKVWRQPLETILAQYDAGTFNFHLWERYLFCLHEQATREAGCLLKVTKWLVEHRKTRLFLNVNHPTSEVFIELARQVIDMMGYPITELRNYVPENAANLPCSLPFSTYVTSEVGVDRKSDPESELFYRKLLEACWISYQ